MSQMMQYNIGFMQIIKACRAGVDFKTIQKQARVKRRASHVREEESKKNIILQSSNLYTIVRR